MATPKFPTISEDQRRRLLEPPSGPVRVVIDTDAKNEIDDQFALAWALLSQDGLNIEGVYAAPFSRLLHRQGLQQAYDLIQSGGDVQGGPLQRYADWARGLAAMGRRPSDLPFDGPDEGMARSYDEIRLIFAKLGEDEHGRVFHGADRFLPSRDKPVRSPATDHLIARALDPRDEPLYVVAIGCPTNIVSALLRAPEMLPRIVVTWTSGYPTGATQPNNASFNLEQDLLASQLLFESGVPLVYLPGFHVGAQLRLSLPEMETWVRGCGAIGDYLYDLYLHNPVQALRGISDHFGRTWVIWDLINIAWLLQPEWVPSAVHPAPVLRDDTTWQRDVPGRHLIREAYAINRDAIFRDFFTKLQRAP